MTAPPSSRRRYPGPTRRTRRERVLALLADRRAGFGPRCAFTARVVATTLGEPEKRVQEVLSRLSRPGTVVARYGFTGRPRRRLYELPDGAFDAIVADLRLAELCPVLSPRAGEPPPPATVAAADFRITP